MASWTTFEGRLSDGKSISVLLAEHRGDLLGASLSDGVQRKGEDEFLWQIDPSLPWQKSSRLADPLEVAIHQLTSYFAGRSREFSLPMQMQGTPFQMRVWEYVRQIPYGQTISYGEVAEEVGYPAAVRAVGNANGRCHFELLIPCHRVVAAGGKLGGYGNNLGMKRRLLAHEATVIGKGDTLSTTAGPTHAIGS